VFIPCIGIGKAISIALNAKYPTDVHFILFDKLGGLLNSTSELLLSSSNSLNQVKQLEIDFSEKHSPSDYKAILQANLPSQEEIATDYGQLICVYNHGTLEFGSVTEIAQQGLVNKFEVNLFSVWSLLAAVTRCLPRSLINKQTHVNISSGYAIEAKANWSGHCCCRTFTFLVSLKLFCCLMIEI